MNTGNEKNGKVVSLSDRASKSPDDNASVSPNERGADAHFDWELVMKRNLENSTRLKSDRNKSNKGVIRSYRLKH